MPLSLKSGDMLTNFVPLDLYVAKPQKVVSILYMLKMIENCVLMLPHCCDTATNQRRQSNVIVIGQDSFLPHASIVCRHSAPID